MTETFLKPLILTPPINPTLVTDGAGLDKIRDFLARSTDKIIGWDKETTPVKDFYWRRDRTWQIGDRNEQYVVDLLAFVDGDSDTLYKSQGEYGIHMDKRLQPVLDVFNPVLCTNNFIKTGVNLGFEYMQSYWCFGQRTWNFFDCSIVERVIQAGDHSLKDYDFYSLERMMARYFDVQIDKTLQTSFDLETPLTEAQIAYAALDTRLPLAIRQKQLQILAKDKLTEIAQIENDAIGSFIDMHVHGQRINTQKWAERDTNKQKELKKVIAEKLDPLFLSIVGSKHDVITEEQIAEASVKWKAYNVVSEEEVRLKAEIRKEKNLENKMTLETQKSKLEESRKVEKEIWKKKTSELGKQRTKLNKLVIECEGEALINYASNAQVLEILQGIKGLKSIKDVEDDSLKSFKGNRYIDAVREYHKLAKQVSTYGKQWTTQWTTKPGAEEGWLHPGDGRLHPKFNQLDAETGRSSSSQPNGQNIPKDKDLRSYFECDPPDETVRISCCCNSECEEYEE